MSAEIQLSWGDTVLCHELSPAGTRFVIGPAASADFVAPVETHVVCVGAGGEMRLETGGRSRRLAASECMRLGPLTLRVLQSAPEKLRFASPAWLFDVGGVALVALYVGLASVFSFPFVPARATAEPSEMQSYLLTRSFGFSIEVERGDATFPLPRPAKPTSDERRAIFAETKARLPGMRARNQGLSAPRREADERRGGTGARAKDDEGEIGNRNAPPLVGTWAMRDRDASRLAKTHPVRWRSWVFAFAPPEEFADEDLTAEWGEETDSAEDDQDVVGNMFGDEPIDPLGSGLGVEGVDVGGGGEAKRVGTGKRKHGHGTGVSSSDGRGVVDRATFRRDVGLAEHVPKAPSLVTEVAPEVVERVVSRARGHLRACGATGNALEFDIGVDGKARNASTSNACVRRVLSGLEFLPAGKITTRARVRIGS